jgi:hypothetical protein
VVDVRCDQGIALAGVQRDQDVANVGDRHAQVA